MYPESKESTSRCSQRGLKRLCIAWAYFDLVKMILLDVATGPMNRAMRNPFQKTGNPNDIGVAGRTPDPSSKRSVKVSKAAPLEP